MKKQHSTYITGKLIFSSKKVLLQDGEKEYFVIPRSLSFGQFLHGDIVRAKLTQSPRAGLLGEVELKYVIHRTREVLLGELVFIKNIPYLCVLSSYGRGKFPLHTVPTETKEASVFSFRLGGNDKPYALSVFASRSDFDFEERLLFFGAGIQSEFSRGILDEANILERASRSISRTASHSKNFIPQRRDFRESFVFTIDGPDAKDLDDAISLKKLENGYELAVHIADVAEYVREGSILDKEALQRATSVYTPGKVVPMLPTVLSDNLCSLHPGSPKLTLSIIMELDMQGNVRKSEIVESIIESKHRGVYDEIYALWKNKVLPKGAPKELFEHVKVAFELYSLLTKRRKKEGKIIFDTTEVYFHFAENIPPNTLRVPSSVSKRERNDAHMLIEEFMVLANEEVAKWCHKKKLPFLSRIHPKPSDVTRQILIDIIFQDVPGYGGNITPSHIRNFLETLSGEELYRYSRILLPKMSKAHYSHERLYHFGLALDFYSHFTSPIRRYPDLQIHRIIKEYIQKKLNPERKNHYKKILPKVARMCSSRERSAEDIERSFDALYACRYMEQFVSKTFLARISGFSPFALFVELENGIEGILYLEREKRYIPYEKDGTLRDASNTVIARIGQSLSVRVVEVDNEKKRIVVERN